MNVYSRSHCVRKIVVLLNENQLKEAFELLDQLVSYVGYSSDLCLYLTAASAKHHRAEGVFELGKIIWDQYDLTTSQVVVKAQQLAYELYDFCYEKNFGAIKRAFKGGCRRGAFFLRCGYLKNTASRFSQILHCQTIILLEIAKNN